MENKDLQLNHILVKFPRFAFLKTSQDITKYFQLLAINKNGTIRRTNRKKLAIGWARSLAKKGDYVATEFFTKLR